MVDHAYVRDTLLASDPDLGRLRQGARAMIAAVAATLVLDGIASAVHKPTTIALIGIAMSMTGTVVVQDDTRRAQQITTALVPIVASLTLCIGTLVSHFIWLRTALFLGVIFLAVFVRKYGPRGMALGMVVFLSYFYSLYFQATPSDLPLMVAGIFVACALSFFIRFYLVRDRPEAMVFRRVGSLRRTIAIALFHLAEAARKGHCSPRNTRALHRALGAVNEAALGLEELAARGEQDVRAPVFSLELAIETLAASVLDFLRASPSESARAELTTALESARQWARSSDEAAKQRAIVSLNAADESLPGPVRSSFDELFSSTKWPLAPAAAPPSGPIPNHPQMAPLRPPSDITRIAIQATLAAALAMAGGYLISSSRAYWAVIASFVVFTRATTLGATLARAWQRIIGTIAGVILGLFIAHWIRGNIALEIAVVFICIFLAYYTLQIAYAWMVASITTLLAVLYSLLGRFTPELLYVRILETLVGALAGAGVAAVVFPAYTREKIRTDMAHALDLLGDYLDHALVERPEGSEDLKGPARALDRELREIRSEVQRASGGLRFRPTRDMARVYQAFAVVFFFARLLASSNGGATLAAGKPGVRAAGERLSANAHRLAGRLMGISTEPLDDPLFAIEQARRELLPSNAERIGREGVATALFYLGRLGESLSTLDSVIRETGISRRELRSS